MLMDTQGEQAALCWDTQDVCEDLAMALETQLALLKSCIESMSKLRSDGIDRLKATVGVGRATLTALVQIESNEAQLLTRFFGEVVHSEWLRERLDITKGLPLPTSEAAEMYLTPVTEALEYNARTRFSNRRKHREEPLKEVPKLDFLGLLRWLKAGYSGRAGQARVYSTAAMGLIDELGLKHKEFVESKSAVTIEVRSYCDNWDKEHGVYSYQTLESWKRICRLMGTFFEAMGLQRPDGLSGDLGVAPGKTVDVSKDLRLRCHFSSVKMQMSHGLAGQLRAFLGEYGST